METVLRFRELVDDWYVGLVKIGDQTTCVSGTCQKNPLSHLQAAHKFFVQGGIRAQCVFNHAKSSQLIVLRRTEDVIDIDVVMLDEKFVNNAKLGSNEYLEANTVFSASTALNQFAKAVFPDSRAVKRYH